MARVTLGLLLEDPVTGSRTEHVLSAGVTNDFRGVFGWRTPAQHQLAQVAKCDRRRAMGMPLDAGASCTAALADARPDRVEGIPSVGIFTSEPGPLPWPGQRHVEPHRR